MLRTTLVVLALLTAATRAQAAVPKQFSVQGVLRDKQGALQSTMLPMVARFLSAATGGTQYGSDYSLGMVPVTNGLFTVVVPAPTILTDLVSASSVYLQLEINSEKYPPQPVAPNVYALMSAQADLALDSNQLGGKPASAYALQSQLTGGTVTSVTAGAGLGGGTITTAGTISVDFAQVAHAVHTHTVSDNKQSFVGQGQGSSCCPLGSNIISGGCYLSAGYITGSFIAGNCWYCNFTPSGSANEEVHAYCM